MTRARLKGILALRVGEAKATRDELHERFLSVSPDDDLGSDAAWDAYTVARDAYQTALEIHFRATVACDSNDLAAQMEVMLALGLECFGWAVRDNRTQGVQEQV